MNTDTHSVVSLMTKRRSHAPWSPENIRGWHKVWPTKRKDGDKEGIVVRAKEKAIFFWGAALHSNHASASNTARPIKCIHQRSRVFFLIRCKQRRTAFLRPQHWRCRLLSGSTIEQSPSRSFVKLHISKFGVNNWHDVSECRATFDGKLMKKALLVPRLCERCEIWRPATKNKTCGWRQRQAL